MLDPTSIFSWLDNVAILGEKLSPAINDWIELQVKLSEGCIKQRKLDRRMRICKRHCRRGGFGPDQIKMQVDLDFSDFTDTQKDEIDKLLIFELLNK